MSEAAYRDLQRYLHRRHPNMAKDDETLCMEVDDNCTCTRKKGHKEDHEAHGLNDILCHSWPRVSEPVVEILDKSGRSLGFVIPDLPNAR